MKIFEAAKEAGITNKEAIAILKENGYEFKSHLSAISDEQADIIISSAAEKADEEEVPTTAVTAKKATAEEKNKREFKAGDMIPCRSVRPNKVILHSTKTDNRYEWNYYGEVIDVDFADLVKMKGSNSSYLYKPLIIPEDPDLCSLWAPTFSNIWLAYAGINNIEDFFNIDDAKFEAKIRMYEDDKNSERHMYPTGILESIKVSSAKLIKEGKFSSLRKIQIIDEVCNTSLMYLASVPFEKKKSQVRILGK